MREMSFTEGAYKWLHGGFLLLLFLLSDVLYVAADVIAHLPDNRTDRFLSMPSTFGGILPKEGYTGPLAVAHPYDACTVIDQAPGDGFIALIQRSSCDFDLKVLNAQLAGFMAVIVSNKDSNRIFPMSGSDYVNRIVIPSVFVGADDGKALEGMNYTTGATITMTSQYNFPTGYYVYFYIFLTVIAMCLLVPALYGIAKFVRDRRRLRRIRLSREHLKKLPIIKFKKGMERYETCAICLDDYEEGNKLRVLPCNHAFHCKCIDPWLTNNRRTCPICKQKVVPQGVEDSDDSESDETQDETTPLLRAGRDNLDYSSRGAVGGVPPPLDVNVTIAPPSAPPMMESYDSGIENAGSVRQDRTIETVDLNSDSIEFRDEDARA